MYTLKWAMCTIMYMCVRYGVNMKGAWLSLVHVFSPYNYVERVCWRTTRLLCTPQAVLVSEGHIGILTSASSSKNLLCCCLIKRWLLLRFHSSSLIKLCVPFLFLLNSSSHGINHQQVHASCNTGRRGSTRVFIMT